MSIQKHIVYITICEEQTMGDGVDKDFYKDYGQALDFFRKQQLKVFLFIKDHSYMKISSFFKSRKQAYLDL